MGDHEAVEAGTGGGGISRRGFMAGAAGLTGVALSGVLRSPLAHADTNPFVDRVITPPGFAFLELNGTTVGSVRAFIGGDPYGNVVTEDPDSDGVIRKHLEGVGFEQITLECALGMAPAFYDWISAFVAGDETEMDGSVTLTDFNLHKKSRLVFTSAFITEVVFPSLDAASTNPVALTVKLLPATSSLHTATGTLSATASNQKQWLSKNFHLELFGGPDGAKVGKIDSFSVRQPLFDQVGKAKFTLPKPVVSDLGFTLPQPQAATWTTWFNNFVINGNEVELGGRLQVRNPQLTTVLAQIDFANLGIYRLDAVAPFPLPADTVRQLRASVYCETLTFTFRP